ncbi:MAG: orotidine-5'-phosphate decarboxylase [Prevotellaceae bacterium]|jgi:orotidine-5'-phosphate decarboxylase|nr:orotidine-5'-phosphate decarboxylase [Prevotellaceae bacterium]
MTATALYEQILRKQSFLCVGLDSDRRQLPACLSDDAEPLWAFNKAIVDATAAYAVAYKPNTAFYEVAGAAGWQQLEKTVRYIRRQHPDIFIIADAKRGDIGNTSQRYAEAFFDTLDVDAVTLSPYMGRDTIQPFLEYPGKWAVLLALTSNASSTDFETLTVDGGSTVYETVLQKSKEWGTVDNTMYVVGATQAALLAAIRKIVPQHFLLVPGVGAQGGSLEEVACYGMNDRCGLLVNISRDILFADSSGGFAAAAAAKAQEWQEKMALLMGNGESASRLSIQNP